MNTDIKSRSDLLALLTRALNVPPERMEAIRSFQDFVWNQSSPACDMTDEEWEILDNLALDLDYYVVNPAWRSQDPAYYGDERVEEEIRNALARLKEGSVGDGESGCNG